MSFSNQNFICEFVGMRWLRSWLIYLFYWFCCQKVGGFEFRNWVSFTLLVFVLSEHGKVSNLWLNLQDEMVKSSFWRCMLWEVKSFFFFNMGEYMSQDECQNSDCLYSSITFNWSTNWKRPQLRVFSFFFVLYFVMNRLNATDLRNLDFDLYFGWIFSQFYTCLCHSMLSN